MGSNTISQKIDAYAQANLKELKQEEAKTGRKMTKFDIAQHMLQQGKLNKNEYANWMNTTEGFNAQAMTQQQKTALKQGNVWGFAGYGGGEESYLDSMTSFSQKNPVEKQNAISHRQMKLNETVAERKKKNAEMNNYIKNENSMNSLKTKTKINLAIKSDYSEELKKYKDILGNIEAVKNIEELFQKLANSSLPSETKDNLHAHICNIADKYVEFYKEHKVAINVAGHEYLTEDNSCKDPDMHKAHSEELYEDLENISKFIDKEIK